MKTDTPITVAIPVYNGAEFIEQAVKSVLDQTVPPSKILVVDDGSTDNTCEIVRQLCIDQPLVKLVISDCNNGPSYVRNLALHLARDAYVAFLDADDVWREDHLSGLTDALCTYPTADVIFTDSRYFGNYEQIAPHGDPCMAKLTAPLLQLLRCNIIPQSGVMLRREMVLDEGGYDARKRYAEDYDLWLRLSVRPQISMVHVKQVTCIRRAHERQVSGTNVDKMIASAWNVRRLVASKLDLSSPEIKTALLAAMIADLSTTWNMRSRVLMRQVLDQSAWIPGSIEIASSWRPRVGYQWPVWRAAAAVYDMLPQSWKALFHIWRTKYRATAHSLPATNPEDHHRNS